MPQPLDNITVVIAAVIAAGLLVLVTLTWGSTRSWRRFGEPASQREAHDDQHQTHEDLATVVGRRHGMIEPSEQLSPAQRRRFLSEEYYDLEVSAERTFGSQFLRIHVDRDGRFWIVLTTGQMLPAEDSG